jgi:ribosomal protein S18 acetylase RimI-like enzyme
VPDDYPWREGALHRAAMTYKRECRWDFAPGEAGAWIFYCVPSDGWGPDDCWSVGANVAGFVVLHDRDEDNRYESIAHLWTAKAARRKGVARRLVNEARRKFPLKRIESPTEEGEKLFRAVWGEYFVTDAKP